MKVVKASTVTETSPTAAGTVIGATLTTVPSCDAIRIDCALLGATGGTLDVYIQRKIGSNAWADWVHFTQLAGGASLKCYSISGDSTTSAIVTTGIGTDAAPGVILAAGSFAGGLPGGSLRVIYVAGSGTSAGAAQSFYVTCFTNNA